MLFLSRFPHFLSKESKLLIILCLIRLCCKIILWHEEFAPVLCPDQGQQSPILNPFNIYDQTCGWWVCVWGKLMARPMNCDTEPNVANWWARLTCGSVLFFLVYDGFSTSGQAILFLLESKHQCDDQMFWLILTVELSRIEGLRPTVLCHLVWLLPHTVLHYWYQLLLDPVNRTNSAFFLRAPRLYP